MHGYAYVKERGISTSLTFQTQKHMHVLLLLQVPTGSLLEAAFTKLGLYQLVCMHAERIVVTKR